VSRSGSVRFRYIINLLPANVELLPLRELPVVLQAGGTDPVSPRPGCACTCATPGITPQYALLCRNTSVFPDSLST
jgi:hypothetical protein